MNEKRELRRFVHQQIKEMTHREEADRMIYENLLQMTCWEESHRIAITLPLPLEIDTRPIIHAAWEAGKEVCVPKVTDNGLTFHIIRSIDELEEGVMNILEPTSPPTNEPIDLCIVPGRVFDRSGYRIGWGGGYYDRFLHTYEGVTVALAYSAQIIDRVPTEPHDLAVEWIVSEREVIQCLPFLS